MPVQGNLYQFYGWGEIPSLMRLRKERSQARTNAE